MTKNNINNFMQHHTTCPFYTSTDYPGIYIIAIPSNEKHGDYVDFNGQFYIIDIVTEEKEGYNLYDDFEDFLDEKNLIKNLKKKVQKEQKMHGKNEYK